MNGLFGLAIRAGRESIPMPPPLRSRSRFLLKEAQRDIDFMRDRLLCPLDYDPSQKGYYYNDETFSLPRRQSF